MAYRGGFGQGGPQYPPSRLFTTGNSNNHHRMNTIANLDGTPTMASNYGQGVLPHNAKHHPQLLNSNPPQPYGPAAVPPQNNQQGYDSMSPFQTQLPIGGMPHPTTDTSNFSDPWYDLRMMNFMGSTGLISYDGYIPAAGINETATNQNRIQSACPPDMSSSAYVTSDNAYLNGHGDEDEDDCDEDDDDDDDTNPERFDIGDLNDPEPKKGKASKKSPKTPSPAKKKKAAGQPPPQPIATFATLAQYTPDPNINTVEDCLAILAFPSDPLPIAIKGEDDWEDVKKRRVHEFAGKIYGVLLAPYKADPNSYPFMKAEGININKHQQQQEKALKKVGELLGTPDMVTRAKSNCLLLVFRAISVNEKGVSKVIKDGYDYFHEQDRVVQRPYTLDLMICSKRLEKIVEVVKENKQIALDVLKGTHLRLAEAPSHQLQLKFTYKDSNVNRQTKVDIGNKHEQEMRLKATGDIQKEAKARAARSKQVSKKRKAPSDDEAEDDSDEVVFSTPVKTRARSVRKKPKRAVEKEIAEEDKLGEGDIDGADEVSEDYFNEQIKSSDDGTDEAGSDGEFPP